MQDYVVITENRDVIIPDSLKKINVQYDNNVKTVTFSCPRYWDQHDLLDMNIYINYQRVDDKKGRYICKNVRIDELDDSKIYFDWTISDEVTALEGFIRFLVCAVTTENNYIHWNSKLTKKMRILKGLECTREIVDSHPDIINDMITRIEKLEEVSGDGNGYISASDDNAGNVTLMVSSNMFVYDDGEGNVIIN